MKPTYKSPLTIYVLWHPDFTDGTRFAESIYTNFCRDASYPLIRGINIPVFFRSQNAIEENIPLDIPFGESDLNAIVILVDDHMFQDGQWKSYVQSLQKNASKGTRFFPVAFSQFAYHFDESSLGRIQFIRADKEIKANTVETLKAQWKLIRSRLLHDFSRQLLGLHSVYEAKEDSATDPPVKLFLSHAKMDGEELATLFRNHIESNTKLNTFFDANDIADGHDFEKQIVSNIDKSGVIVFHSDEYSNREWCRAEVITAKRVKAPIVIVHNIEKGEHRSFPYLGNAPCIKWNNNIEEIIDLTLVQVLNNLFADRKLRKEIEQYELEKKFICISLCSPPELFNYIDIERARKGDRRKILVIYPDPPLGIEELKVLNDIDDKIDFVTPVLLPAQ